MNIGVLGGTFDPVHNGHLLLAEEVRDSLKMDKILFIPAGQPWVKSADISPAEHRVAMVRLAIEHKPHFEISTMEIDRQGPTYTVDTLRELKSAAGGGDNFYFIMGWDNLSLLPRWVRPREIISLCRLVAVPRPGYPLPDIKALEEKIPGLSASLIMLKRPEVDISSTGVREMALRGQPVDGLVPEAVAAYIRKHNLYRKQEA